MSHDLTRRVEAPDVTQFSNDGHCGDELEPPKSHQAGYYWLQGPSLHCSTHFFFQCRYSALHVLDRVHILLQHNLLGWHLKSYPFQPSKICLCPPAPPRKPLPMSQKKCHKPLFCMPFHGFHVFTGTGEISYRFLF